MLMESVQGLSFSNVRTRRLEKVGEVLDKHMTTSVEVSSPTCQRLSIALVMSTMKESLIHRSQFLVIIFRCRPLLSDKGSS